MAATRSWICFCGLKESAAAEIRTALVDAGLELADGPAALQPGIVCFSDTGEELLDLLRQARQSGVPVLALSASTDAPNPDEAWRLLNAGAADTLVWHNDRSCGDKTIVRQILARLERWNTIDALSIDAARRVSLIGAGRAWTALTRRVVEAARFTNAPVLLIGESGTGKELIARLIHLAGARSATSAASAASHAAGATDPVTVDCSTIVAELSGSEFFGHEKGAFTGAVASRDGAFAAADQGTLFLDEVGELPMGLQVQLLRVVQEKTYKRVGGNVWQRTDFRLVSATNRDLGELVARGQFRLDLYHRLAGWVIRLPALRDRREDILPLAAHFLGECGRAEETGDPEDSAPREFDDSVCAYLVNRDYPGNVRELRQLVHRIAHRHAGPGPITAGDIPPEDRPADGTLTRAWPDERLDVVIRDALTRGFGLKEIGCATTDAAIRLALLSENGNVRRAARRLGVTDRALQLRRASRKVAS
jgi:transcriptional regulator with GAF, ATPase, and Fis domain